MSVHYRNTGGTKEWFAPTWADLMNLIAAGSAKVGDRCWFGSTCYLTRRSVATADGFKTRWVPDDPRWGKNNLAHSEVPVGVVTDEGVWTLSTGSTTLTHAQMDKSYEALGIVFDCTGGNCSFLTPVAPDDMPHFLSFRCAYRATLGAANSAYIYVDRQGVWADVPNSAARHGQFAAFSGGGGGGGGGDAPPWPGGVGGDRPAFLNLLADSWGQPTWAVALGGASGFGGGTGTSRASKIVGAADMGLGNLCLVGGLGATGGLGYGGFQGGTGGLGGGALFFAAAVSSLARPLVLSATGGAGVAGQDGDGGGDSVGGGGGGGGGSGGLIVDIRPTNNAVTNLLLSCAGGAGGAGGAGDKGNWGSTGGIGGAGIIVQGV